MNTQTTSVERPRRMLLDEWSPPQPEALSDDDTPANQDTTDQDHIEVPDGQAIGFRVYLSPDSSPSERRASRQRCGGGYRILRKKIGG